jgi:uncharacterized membrane protein YbhN (UPF0104 family)
VSATPPPKRPASARRFIRPLLSVVVLGAVALWISRSANLDDFLRAVERMPAWALAVGYFIGGLNITIGAIRWRILMQAFGARTLASRGEFLLATFVAQFYNTFVPGSFGGDLVRGYITRKSFDQAATGLYVVFFERFVGLSALCVVAAAGLLVGPRIVDYAVVGPWLLGAMLVLLVVVGLAAFTGRLARFRSLLPAIRAPRLLWPAFAISLLGHLTNLVSFTVLATAMGLPLGLTDLALVVPLGLLATIVPIAMAGVGAREATLVGLLSLLHIPTGDAVVFTLGFALVNIGLALTGGIIQLVQPKVLRYH